ncbi:MAG TPA: hypothetical protein VJ692_03655, partial [Nitrospiraceae bacterium]|nr:hypothetical protein [Nitrospiraceae bacterium]
WTPTDADWRRGGRILAQLALQHGWDAKRIQDLQNDVIALTARQYGATFITTNRKDFEELSRIIEFQTIYV